MMSQILLSLVNICLFRSKPQDLPASKTLVIYSALAAIAVFVIRNTQLSFQGNGLAIAVTQVALLGLSLKLLLAVFSKPERWNQSATALFGCSAVVVAIVIPFLISSTPADMSLDSWSITKLAVIFSSVWYFAIIIFIFRETLEIGLFLAFIVTLVVELALASVLLQIFGDQIL